MECFWFESRLPTMDKLKEAVNILTEQGYYPKIIGKSEINFKAIDGSNIKYFPYSKWATGKAIKDGRGLHNLLKQI